MGKNVYTSLLAFISLYLFFFSCTNDEVFQQNQSSILKTNLKSLTNETKTILRSLDVKQQGSPQMAPYNALAKRQSALLANYIDTNLNGNYADTAALIKKLNKLKTEYKYVLDSTIKASAHPLFLTQDYEHLKSIKVGLLNISKTDFTLNYCFTMQSIIMCHNENLRNYYSYVGSSCGYIRYFFNSNINVYENDKLTSLKIYCNAYKTIAKLQVLKGAKIQDTNDKNVSLVSYSIQGDTSFITTAKLKPGNYRAIINYNIINASGNEYQQEIPFSFSAR